MMVGPLVMLFSALALADDFRLLKILDEIEKTLWISGVPVRCLGDEEGSSEDIRRKCALQLCGPPKEIADYHIAEFNFDKPIPPYALQLFSQEEPKFKGAFDAVVEQNNELIAKFEKILSKGKPISALAKEIFTPYIKNTDHKSKKIYVTYPDDIDMDFKKGLYAFANTGGLCNEKCQSSLSAYLKKNDFDSRISQLKRRIGIVNFQEKLKDKIAECKSYLAIINAHSVDYDYENIKNKLNDTKEKFLDNVFKNYSSSSREKFVKYLDSELNMTLPVSRRDKIKRYVEGIKNSLKPKELPEKFTDLVKELLSRRTDPFLPLEKMCSSPLDKDIFSVKDGMHDIGLSKFSCTHHYAGQRIFAHELGHAVSYSFQGGEFSNASFGRYKKLSTCASSMMHKNTRDSAVGKFHHEEHIADLFSAMTFVDDKVLNGCHFLRRTKDMSAWDKLSLDEEKKLYHPTDFMRLLQEAVHKRVDLPDSCKKVIADNSGSYGFGPCF